MTLHRHDWVYLRAGAAPALAGADAPSCAWIESWLARGGPLVVARQPAAEGRVALGIALPASHGAARIACSVDAGDIARLRGPITVDEAATALLPPEASALARFAGVLAGHVVQLGVYGSTAWQFLTGETYRHAQSDIDVICDVASRSGFTACLAAFADAARYFPTMIDGELRFAGGRAVAWRELHNACNGGPAVVLAKSEREIALFSLGRILAALR
jgi:phosphoribosyl-dephospho-CoA transferase